MKKLLSIIFAALALSSLCHAQEVGTKSLVVRIVNFKKCVEQSKLGKQEQSSFEALKKQMETVLAEKEKTLNDMAAKFEDPDYLDSLSAESETELKRKFRSLSQEFSLLQNQYLQSLQQTNFKIVQKLTEHVSKAAKEVAKQNQIDLVLNDEAAFFSSEAIDISKEIIAILDQNFEKEAAEKK